MVDPEPALSRLIAAEIELNTVDLLDELDRPITPPPGRPRVIANMVGSLDGRATRGGRSGGLSSGADRALFHALRASVDAVLAGAGTIRVERYGPMLRDERLCSERVRRGRTARPIAVTVSNSLDFDPKLPLLDDPQTTLVVLTERDSGELPPCRARIEYIRETSIAEQLAALRERFGVRSLLCEGGPTLLGELLGMDLLDELYLTLTPRLLGGGAERALVEGVPIDVRLGLRDLLRHEDELFARYEVRR